MPVWVGTRAGRLEDEVGVTTVGTGMGPTGRGRERERGRTDS
jgi:hypothetical protein